MAKLQMRTLRAYRDKRSCRFPKEIWSWVLSEVSYLGKVSNTHVFRMPYIDKSSRRKKSWKVGCHRVLAETIRGRFTDLLACCEAEGGTYFSHEVARAMTESLGMRKARRGYNNGGPRDTTSNLDRRTAVVTNNA